jgi:cytochrome c oxidase cbb3-type subunit 3
MPLQTTNRSAWIRISLRFGVSIGLIIAAAFSHSGQKLLATPAQKGAGQGEAQLLFGSICASCHGLNARGGERGPDIATRPEVTRKSDAELKEILRDGRTSAGMPGFDSLGPEKLSELVAYLRVLQRRGSVSSLPGDPSRGKDLFLGKAKCSECHLASGQGGFSASDLTSYAARLGVEEVRERVVHPDKGLDPRKGTVEVVLRDSSKLSGLVRNEDNFSLQVQSADGVFHLLNKSDIRTQAYTGKSGMPTDYGSTLSAAEVNDIVSYLLRISGPEDAQKKDDQSADHDE